MMTMKTKTCGLLSLVCGVVLGALSAGGSAQAADLAAYKASPAATTYDWSGFYVGATVGGGLASLPIIEMDHPNNQFFPNARALKSTGAVAGLHLGYNWQIAPSFLVGLEGDFNWSSFKASDTECFVIPCDPLNQQQFTDSSKLNNFSTARARLGLASDRTLLYVTAGPAWGHINPSLTITQCPNCASPGATFLSAADSSSHLGIAVGAGVEYALTQNWIVRGEYMHLDFTAKEAQFRDLLNGNVPIAGRASSTATADIARVGISYKVW